MTCSKPHAAIAYWPAHWLLAALLFVLPAAAQEPVPDEAASEPQQTPPVAAAGGEESLLDRKAADHEKAWLTVAGNKELAFYLSETTGRAHGGVLLIPGLGGHPNARGMIRLLRQSLADNHWHTLAVDMTGTTEETAQQMIIAGIDYLNQQGIFNIAVLGEGMGAAQALHYVSTLSGDQLQQIRALLMVNADNRISGSANDTLQQLGEIKVPVLDAYTSGDYVLQQRADERKRAARRLMNKNYQQVRLPQPGGTEQTRYLRLSKRIRGWLDNNAAGFMVDNR